MNNFSPLNFHTPIQFKNFTEAIAILLTVTNYCIQQTQKKQLNLYSHKLQPVKFSNVLAMIFNHLKTLEKKEKLFTDPTRFEIVQNFRIEVG